MGHHHHHHHHHLHHHHQQPHHSTLTLLALTPHSQGHHHCHHCHHHHHNHQHHHHRGKHPHIYTYLPGSGTLSRISPLALILIHRHGDTARTQGDCLPHWEGVIYILDCLK